MRVRGQSYSTYCKNHYLNRVYIVIAPRGHVTWSAPISSHHRAMRAQLARAAPQIAAAAAAAFGAVRSEADGAHAQVSASGARERAMAESAAEAWQARAGG